MSALGDSGNEINPSDTELTEMLSRQVSATASRSSVQKQHRADEPETASKPSVRKRFFNLWKSNYNIPRMCVISFTLFVLEEMMEMEFKCSYNKTSNLADGICFFVVPAILFFGISFLALPQSFLSCYCEEHQPSSCCKCCCCSCHCNPCMFFSAFFKAFAPAYIWVTLLFLDGRYAACMMWDPHSSHNQSNATSKVKSIIEEEPLLVQRSQMVGMGFIVVLCIFTLVSYYRHICYCGSRCRCFCEGKHYYQVQYEAITCEMKEEWVTEEMKKNVGQKENKAKNLIVDAFKGLASDPEFQANLKNIGKDIYEKVKTSIKATDKEKEQKKS